MPEMDPFQLTSPVPEIGAEAGDWVVPDDEGWCIRVVRRVPLWTIPQEVRRELAREAARAAGHDAPPVGRQLRRVK